MRFRMGVKEKLSDHRYNYLTDISDVDFEGAQFRLGGYFETDDGIVRGLFVSTVAISLSFSVSS